VERNAEIEPSHDQLSFDGIAPVVVAAPRSIDKREGIEGTRTLPPDPASFLKFLAEILK
jgi:hypothetical protein